MSTALITRPSLEALAERANAEHAEVLSTLRDSVTHAIAAGDALLEARSYVQHGAWLQWLSDNFDGGQATGQQYMRLAFHKEHILEAPEPMPLKRAYLYIRGLPAIDRQARKGYRPEPNREDVTEAKRLRASGMTYAAIGEVFGLSDSTIRMWLKPDYRKRARAQKRREYRRRRDARLALRQKERDEAARKAGGGVSEGYSLIRRASQVLDRAAEEAETPPARAAILDSIAALHKAEDELVRALGVTHGRIAKAKTHKVAA